MWNDEFRLKDDKYCINARHKAVKAGDKLSIPLIKHCIRTALRLKMIELPCEVSVLITNDKNIRKMNNEFRHKDEPTDVLSFPMQEYSAPAVFKACRGDLCIVGDYLQLGDIVISAERVKVQASQYRNLLERETAYLVVHSTLHLLGYDHIEETDRKLMREQEKMVLDELGIN